MRLLVTLQMRVFINKLLPVKRVSMPRFFFIPKVMKMVAFDVLKALS